MPASGYVLVGTTQIDGVFRSDHGALVVTMTGMAWGTRACEAMYEATLTDAAHGVVEILRSTDIRPGEACPDVGHRHVLTVAGETRAVGDTIVDAIDGSSIDVVDGTEGLRPTWWSDRRTLPNCGTDDDRQSPEINASSRACFREAYEAQRPAEIEVISFGDEGDSVHRLIRILSSEQFEILEEIQPPAHPLQPPLSPWQWQSFRCRSLEFRNDPGSDVDGRVSPATDCISTRARLVTLCTERRSRPG